MNGCNTRPAADWPAWVGREEGRPDVPDLRTAQALAATLDHDPEAVCEAGELPPLWHWVYFTPRTRRRKIGPDGHARRGGFVPAVDLPNRMWASGRRLLLQRLHIGEYAERVSRILLCERKRGRSGDLAFVTVEHAVSTNRGAALVEEHDIVYRQPPDYSGPLAGGTPTAVA